MNEQKILNAFDELASGNRKLKEGAKRAKPKPRACATPTITTAEITCMWAGRAVGYCMTRERRRAANAVRPPSLQTNPFHVLPEGRYRTREQLEAHYEAHGARSPLQLRDGSVTLATAARRVLGLREEASEEASRGSGLPWVFPARGSKAAPGHPRVQIPCERSIRHAGTTKWNYLRLSNFVIEAAAPFLLRPPNAASCIGLLVALIAFAHGTAVLVRTIVLGDAVPGYPGLMAAMIFLVGVQLLCLGILGGHQGRMCIETRQWPLSRANEFKHGGDVKNSVPGSGVRK